MSTPFFLVVFNCFLSVTTKTILSCIYALVNHQFLLIFRGDDKIYLTIFKPFRQPPVFVNLSRWRQELSYHG